MHQEKVQKMRATRGGSSNASNCNAWSLSPNLFTLFYQGPRRTITKDEYWIDKQWCFTSLISFGVNLVCRRSCKYEVQTASAWPLGGNQISGPPYANPAMKQFASEEFSQDWENKRLNSGNNMQINGQQLIQSGFDQIVGAAGNPRPGMYAPYTSVSSGVPPNWQAPVQFPHQ